MRGYAGTIIGSREKLTLANGIPVTIALEYSSGKRVPSRIAGAPDQVYYTLTDGRAFYADLDVAEMIERLGLVTQEPFTICKYGPRDWEVQRAGAFPSAPINSPAQPQRAATRVGVTRATESSDRQVGGLTADNSHTESTSAQPVTKLEQALKTAILASANAEKYGAEIGYTVRFTPEAIKCMAISVLIGMEQGGRR